MTKQIEVRPGRKIRATKLHSFRGLNCSLATYTQDGMNYEVKRIAGGFKHSCWVFTGNYTYA